jgi:cation transport ATPase
METAEKALAMIRKSMVAFKNRDAGLAKTLPADDDLIDQVCARALIKQNVAFALSINIVGLFLSTQGFVSPVLASIIHESNALIVVFNSLRLARRKW